jgi:hypothetical protein
MERENVRQNQGGSAYRLKNFAHTDTSHYAVYTHSDGLHAMDGRSWSAFHQTRGMYGIGSDLLSRRFSPRRWHPDRQRLWSSSIVLSHPDSVLSETARGRDTWHGMPLEMMNTVGDSCRNISINTQDSTSPTYSVSNLIAFVLLSVWRDCTSGRSNCSTTQH